MYYNSPTCAAYEGPTLCTAIPQLQLFTYIIKTFIYKLSISQFCDLKVNSKNYDFVVVGGGTAGAVIAARLSEIREWSVLLLEAGPEEPLSAMVPSMVANYLGSELDWKYQTTNEPNACKSNNGSCFWPRGKNLGGTSVHNGMMYMRGHREDYDNWGLPDWSYENVLPFFKKSERNFEFSDEYHGNDGLLPVNRFPWQPPLANDILEAAKEINVGVSPDLNGDQITGFMVAQTMNANGVRASTASAFLRPARDRPNLTVLLNAQATKIRMERRGNVKTATGIYFTKDNVTYYISAKKEVILSGGAIGSPHLLLLSGIGPKDQLKSKNVKVMHELPGVGENLQNHVAFPLSFTIAENDTDVFLDASLQYMFNQTGPMSSTGMSQITGIVASDLTTPEHPDLQFFFSGYTTTCSPSSNQRRIIGINPTYLHPKSRGTLKLASKNPFDHPLITQNYLTHSDDVEGLVEAIKVALQLAGSEALKKYDMQLVINKVSACANFTDDDYWRCAITWDTGAENHQAGSCKMGLADDPMAVVDTELRVHGVKKLRVADASVIPTLTSGNTVAPIVMIAERVAEFIKEDYVLNYDTPYCRRRRRENPWPGHGPNNPYGHHGYPWPGYGYNNPHGNHG